MPESISDGLGSLFPAEKLESEHAETTAEVTHAHSPPPGVILFVFGSCVIGAISRSLLKKLPIPYTVFLLIIGLLFGLLSSNFSDVKEFTTMARVDPEVILHVFLPVLVFESAFSLESHTFFRTFPQILLLAVPGLAVASFLTAVFAKFCFLEYDWDWFTAMMYGSILSATDPVAVVSLLKDVGASKQLATLIDGESLLNDGAGIVFFRVFQELSITNGQNLDALLLVWQFVRVTVGGPLFGLICGKLVTFWLSRIFNDAITEITITLAATYVTFYVGDRFLSVSGVLAVVVLGVVMSADKTSISPEVEAFLHRFWEMLGYLANTLIFLLVGVVITEQAVSNLTGIDVFYIFMLYIAVTLIRGFVIALFSPILKHTGYGLDWKNGAVLTWGGLRGAVGLALALQVSRSPLIDQTTVGNKVLLHTAGIVLLTLIVNATTFKWFLKALGMSDISMPRRMAMAGAVRQLQKNRERTLNMLKTDRFLADSDWDYVEKHTAVLDPYKTTEEEADLEDLTYLKRVSHCPECETVVQNEPSPKEKEEMEEEARRRLLKAQKTSYWKQFEHGMLSRGAVRKLIESTEEAMDKAGGYVNIEDLKTTWQVRGFYAYMRRKLENWIHSSPTSMVPPPEKECLINAYFISNSMVFEIIIYIVIILNLIPILIDLIMGDDLIYHKDLALGLRITNYFFLAFYIIEAVIKICGLRKAYFKSHWGQFDMIIILLSVVDVVLDFVFGAEESALGESSSIFRVAKIFRLLRISRVLRLFKVLIPPVLSFLNSRINSRLSFGYDIGMGYVVGEDEVRKVIYQMIDDKKICDRLARVVDQGRLDVVRDLGLLQRDMPGIAVSVKTRHSIRIILNNLRDNINTLRGDGLLDENEGSKLEQMVEELMKRQQNTPSYIAPPSPDRIMKNIPWIDGDPYLLGFVKQKARLVCFDYGHEIMRRGDVPKGIYIIVSGMVKVEVAVGDYRAQDNPVSRVEQQEFVDYLSTGSIIGEMGVITNKPRNATVICETSVQCYFLAQEDMLLALECFRDDISLEYRLWRVVAIRIAIPVLMNQPQYQGWTQDRIKMYLETAYLADIDGAKIFEFLPFMKDVILIQGYAQNAHTRDMYAGPCYIHSTVSRLLLTQAENRQRLKHVILVVPTDISNIPSSIRLNITGLNRPQKVQESSLCLMHASKHRIELSQSISRNVIAQRNSIAQLIKSMSRSRTAFKPDSEIASSSLTQQVQKKKQGFHLKDMLSGKKVDVENELPPIIPTLARKTYLPEHEKKSGKKTVEIDVDGPDNSHNSLSAGSSEISRERVLTPAPAFMPIENV